MVRSTLYEVYTSNAIEKLREIFATHGLPATLVDHGYVSNFTCSEFEELLKRNDIEHIEVAPYHPERNHGLAERTVRVLKGFEKMGKEAFKPRSSDFSYITAQLPTVQLEFHQRSY